MSPSPVEHPQVPRPWAEDGLVDEGMLPLLACCRANGISTVYSCQGRPGEVRHSEVCAYIMFETLADVDRFYTRMLGLVAGDEELTGRFTGNYWGTDWVAGSLWSGSTSSVRRRGRNDPSLHASMRSRACPSPTSRG